MEISIMMDLPEHISFLKQQDKYTTPVTFAANHTVYELGSPCTNLLVVTKGCLKVSSLSKDGRYMTLYRVYPFDTCFLSISCILNETPFPALATIDETLEGILIPATNVTQWMNDYEVWRMYIFRHMATHLYKMVELTDSVAFEKLNKRLADWLSKHANKTMCTITHQNLANELGTTREVVTRVLHQLKSKP
jgi:CRP/FNR family transcriptional regulator